MIWSEMSQSKLDLAWHKSVWGDHICHENLGDGGACTAYSLSRAEPNQPSANIDDGPKPSNLPTRRGHVGVRSGRIGRYRHDIFADCRHVYLHRPCICSSTHIYLSLLENKFLSIASPSTVPTAASPTRIASSPTSTASRIGASRMPSSAVTTR